MTMPAARRRGIAGMSLIALTMVAVLLSLGFWQLQRRTAKQALIAAMSERLAAAPVPLPAAAEWSRLTPAADEFRRVSFTAGYARQPDAMVYSAGSAVRPDAAGPGTWAFLPARLAGGETVVVNAGYVPNPMQDRALQDRAVAKLIPGEPMMLTGYLRFPESAGLLTPAADPSKRLWLVRDLDDMARQLGWGGGRGLAPFYVDLEAPAPAEGGPKPGPLEVRLRDQHLQYAITWFGLAGAVVIAFAVWLRGQRRARPEPAARRSRRVA